MEQKKDERKLQLKDDVSFMEEQSSVASSMDCTGLMPSLPTTEDEAESYSDLYPVPAPRQVDDVEIRKKPIRRHKEQE